MKTLSKNLITRRSAASGEARACHGAASKRTWVLLALTGSLSLILAGRLMAESFKVLHSFTGGGDGAFPTTPAESAACWTAENRR